MPVWCADQAGPFPTMPHPGAGWEPEGEPARLPHEYARNGTAKVMTLFHPATGITRLEGTTTCPNAVLHPWLKGELSAILAGLPDPTPTTAAARSTWERWQAGLGARLTPPAELPPLRMLPVLDHLAGHKAPAFVLWLFAHGVMPPYTPLSGSWPNMAESIQRVLKRRALDGQNPTHPDEIMSWFAAAADHWNRNPTPFAWGGKRAARRKRERERRHRVGGSGAPTRRPIKKIRRRTYGHAQCN